jgi:simple sugar transport system permease protein
MDKFAGLINADLFASSLRIGAPLILAALGGLMCMKARIFNIALEGFMLIGSFFAIVVVALTGGNVWLGLLGGVLAGILTSLLYALVVIRFNADVIVSGIAINLFSLGITAYLLKTFYGTSGAYRPEVMNKIPNIALSKWIHIPFLGDAFFDHSPIVFFSIFMVLVTYTLLYKTPFGLAVQSVGEQPLAARTAGIRPETIYLLVIIWSGALSGLAGAHLSTGIISEFTENMVQGRGFTAFTAIVFGGNHPVWTFLACTLFGFADALGIRIEITGMGLPSSILKMFPYLLSVIVLTISSAIRAKQQSGLTGRVIG